MQLITHNQYNLSKRNYSYNIFGGAGEELTNADEYADDGTRYRWRNPYPVLAGERFVRIASGNRVRYNDNILQEISYEILCKVNDASYYTLPTTDFQFHFIKE
jgi:hypothetical protein